MDSTSQIDHGKIDREEVARAAATAHRAVATGEQQKPKRKLRILSVKQLLAENPRMRPPVVDGIIREGETMNVIAAPKAGKSWLTIDLALAVATGRDWLGFPTVQGDVLILDNELHSETSANRIPKVAEARGLHLAECEERAFVTNVRGMAFTMNDLPELLNDVEPGRYKLIILDAWYKFIPPGADENSNADVGGMYATLDMISARLGCAVVCVHHLSRGNQAGKSVTDSGSGAGAQSRAADTHLVLRQHTDPDVLVAEAVTRSFPGPAPMCLRRRWPVFDIDTEADPKDLHNPGKRQKQADKADKPEPIVRNYKTFVEDCIGALPEPERAITAKAVGCSYSPTGAGKLLRQAVGAGLVTEMQNPSCRREKLYCRA